MHHARTTIRRIKDRIASNLQTGVALRKFAKIWVMSWFGGDGAAAPPCAAAAADPPEADLDTAKINETPTTEPRPDSFCSKSGKLRLNWRV